MTRRGWICVVFVPLFVGAAINVTLVWWSHRPAQGNFMYFFLSEDPRPQWLFAVSNEFARTQVVFYKLEPSTLYNWDSDRVDAELRLPEWSSLNDPSRDESAAYEEYFTEVGAGWPFICFVSLYERSRSAELGYQRQQRVLAWQMLANTGIITCMVLCSLVALCTSARVRSFRRARNGQCPACGYDLSGTSRGTCPECGRSPDLD